MKVSGAGNSVTAKARAMYADRLTQQDFNALLAMQSTAEVAEYLKSKTCYSAALQGFSATAPYRGQLISLLRTKLFEEFSSLCRYENSIGENLYKYFILHNDCLQILLRLRTLGDVDEDYVSSLPSHYVELSNVDLYALVKVDTVSGVISCLENTEYKQLLTKNENLIGSRDGLLFVEAEMNAYCGRRLVELVKADCTGAARSELLDAIKYYRDTECIVRLYRLKKLMNSPEAVLRRFVVPELTLLTKRELDSILSAPDCDAMVNAVLKTRYAPVFQAGGDPEAAAFRLRVQATQKRFRFSKSAAESLWCFMALREAEINDITNIFEGVRCKASPETIKQYIYCVSL